VTISPSRRWGTAETWTDGVRVLESPDLFWGMGRSGWDPWDVINRVFILSKHRYDLVHAFDSRPAVIYPALLERRRGSIFVSDWADWWGRGGVISERKSFFLRRVFAPIETYFEEHFRRQAVLLTVISRALWERAQNLGVSPDRLQHLPSGADIETIRPLPKAEARQQLGLDATAHVVGFVGFVHYDLELLVEAFKHVDRRVDRAVLLVIGGHSPLLTALRESATLRGKVVETGAVDFKALPPLLACADVFALPFTDRVANRGRWPNKVGDYLAAGRPVVTNPVGDINELFQKERIGLLAPEHSEGFAEALIAILKDPTLQDELGRGAREVAERRLSWAQLTESLISRYAEL